MDKKLQKCILMNDRVGEHLDKGWLLSKTIPTQLLRGEIFQCLPEAEQPKDSERIALQAISATNQYIKLECRTLDVCKITDSEADLLLAISSAEERFRIFRERNRLDTGKSLSVGCKVFVRLKNSPKELPGVIWYIGPLPTNDGTVFGVELLEKVAFFSVLNARNLVALDTNGLSDPYVVLRLQPAHLFGRQERKTKVMKNTLFPLFDEKFSFSITADQCRIKGACLSLTVLDYDVISNDDIEGQAFLPLNILAGLDSPIQGGFANEPQITLDLMHPTPDGVAFEILEYRKDKEAEAFVKNEKLTYKKTRSAHS